jgi:dCTP deaminase
MSLKNDNWIIRQCKKHGLISPFVEEQVGGGIISYGVSSFGYDVRAGFNWKIFTDVLGAVVDPKHQDNRAFHNIDALKVANAADPTNVANMLTPLEVPPIIIPPNSYALTHTLEYIKVPRNVTCVCIGKSTYARCGIHVNVTPLEAGWEGQVTVEISNGTRLPVKVYPGEGIMQVLFFEGEEPDVSYADRKGKYQGQKGITLAQVLEPKKDLFLETQKKMQQEIREKMEAEMKPLREMLASTPPEGLKYGATFKQYNQLQESATHAELYKWTIDVFNGKRGSVEPALRQYLEGAGLWPPKKSSGKPAVRTARSR